MKQSKIAAIALGVVLATAATFTLPPQQVSAQQQIKPTKKPTTTTQATPDSTDPPLCPPNEPDCPYQ